MFRSKNKVYILTFVEAILEAVLGELEETLRVELIVGVSQVGGECLETELAAAGGLGGVTTVKLSRVHAHAIYQ